MSSVCSGSYYKRVAAHDIAGADYYNHLGQPHSLPTALINSTRYFLPDTTIAKELQSTSDNLRNDEASAVLDFINRLDSRKMLWRPAQGSRSSHTRSTGFHLYTSTDLDVVNTGQRSLCCGEAVYVMPAISSLANSNPSVNIFSYLGGMYVHPMLLTSNERTSLADDLFNISNDEEETGIPKTTIGGMIKKYHINQMIDVDMAKVITYVRDMVPLGVVMYNLGESRRTLYEVTPNTVTLGSSFKCQVNPFAC